jgi:hypothetical protein
MRVLTVKQPWAWAIIHGGKDVENRVKSLGPYRGPVAIHAAKGWAAAAVAFLRALGIIPPPCLIRGHIIGVVDLVGVHEWSDDAVCYGHEGADGEATCSPWGMPDHHHLVLANPRALARPIPARGMLGLWRPDAEIEAVIRDQIGGA